MAECIAYGKTNYFSSLIVDYLAQNESLKEFYNRFPNQENFKAQIEEKSKSYQKLSREVLQKAITQQYSEVSLSETTQLNIQSLSQENTFTITTGHQLNLFTGPLYFLYKIVSTINLTKQLKETYPEYNFVPVYWMATEDHDFDEISFFNFKGKKIHWNRANAGAVGHFSTEGLEEVFQLFSQDLGIGKNAETLRELFTNAYLKHNNLTEATRYLVNELFGEYGLVIVDGDDKALKELFVPYVKEDIFKNTAFQQVSKSAEKLADLGYNVQVNPREINMFYLTENGRERIVEVEGNYEVLDTTISFSKETLLQEIENHPEKFSPNVIMRPLYQEVILPNLCYIGGGGELAYWLELKSNFETVQVPFPILLLRNSALIVTQKQADKLQRLNISYPDLFLKRDQFINKKVRAISNIDIDFSEQKKFLQKQFKAMYTLAEETDESFVGAVKAQEVKQLKGLENLEKRLLKAQKRKLADQVTRMTDIQNELFPNQSLQERNFNFSEIYLEYGEALIPMLFEELQPLNTEFLVLEK